MKRFSIVLGLVLALSLVFVGSAFANFGPHGGYATDTDACAGCHRAHSSFSEIQFVPSDAPDGMLEEDMPYALLVGSASTIEEFCYACHGDLAPGAATNVASGVFDSGPSGDSTILMGGASQTDGTDGGSVVVSYLTESTFGAPLNGGGFGSIIAARADQIVDTAQYMDSAGATVAYKDVSSAHSMEAEGVLWGAGNTPSTLPGFTCTGCHDPHGSSNYRLLRDTVNGNTRGGYIGDVPNPWVMSTETGYPVADGGWLKHDDGAAQMTTYRPDYTAGSLVIAAGVSGKSMSSWCAGCHTSYDHNSGVVSVDDVYDPAGQMSYGTYEDAGGLIGAQTRHRHPVDITLVQGDGILEVDAQALDEDLRIPLEQAGTGDYRQDHVGCVTCHFAHGSAVTMSGWSNASLVLVDGIWVPERDSVMGVNPDKVADPMALNNTFTDEFTGAAVTAGTSALLRADNRGVCERCHDK